MAKIPFLLCTKWKAKKKKNLSNRSEQCTAAAAAADVLVWYQSSRAEQHEALHLSPGSVSERATDSSSLESQGQRWGWGGVSHPPTTFILSFSLSLPLLFSSALSLPFLSQCSIPIRSNSSKDMLRLFIGRVVLFYQPVSICGTPEVQRASWLLTSAVQRCREMEGGRKWETKGERKTERMRTNDKDGDKRRVGPFLDNLQHLAVG